MLWLLVALFTSGLSVANAAGTNQLPASQAARTDELVHAQIPNCRFINIGVVSNGRVVLTRAYGRSGLGDAFEYGSVSKPVTSTIIMQLRREGRIKSLDDNVWTYVRRYRNAMPEAYGQSPLTLKHLLTHRSGIPHNDQPPVVDGRFNLKFRPGTAMQYSTPGYGILGEVIEAVTGLSYDEAVAKYIGEPVGAPSFRAAPSFIAPGAFVYSTIGDMARFAIGIMDNRYMPEAVLYNEVLRPETGTYGYGWSVANLDGNDLKAFHGGSNGLPRAHLLMKPRQKNAVVILAQLKSYVALDLNALAEQIMALIESRTSDQETPPK